MSESTATLPTPGVAGREASLPQRAGGDQAIVMSPSTIRAILVALTVTTGALLVIYGLTMAPDLTWANNSQDGGELITAAVSLGIPHPPGYPLYVLIGKLFSFLPIGTIAFRVNLLSAVSVALAGGILAALLRLRVTQSPAVLLVAVAGGITFGLLPPVWGQATVAEVYGLNLLFVALFLFCLLGKRAPATTGIFLGLAITSHLSSVLLVPLALWPTPSRQYGRLFAGLVAGLLPFLLLFFLGRSDSPVMWGSPDDLAGWWWLVRGQLYAANVRLPVTLTEVRQSLLRPGLWVGPLIVIGGVFLARIAAGRDRPADNNASWALGLTAALYGIVALIYQTADAYVLLLPGLMVLVYLAFTSLRWTGWVAMLVPVLLLVGGFGRQNLRDDTAVRPLAESVLAAAPENAILLTPGDRTIFTLWYFHHAEQQRPDLTLVDQNLLAFDWYRARLHKQYPGLQGLTVDDLSIFQRENAARPLCFTSLVTTPANPQPAGYTHWLGAADQEVPYLNCREKSP